jgi:thiamine monophosphate synthase
MYILAITPGTGLDRTQWERMLRSGIDSFMIREPAMTPRSQLAAARWARGLVPDLELWLNGRLDVALLSGCGLHAPEAYPPVPERLLPLSRPVHHPDQLMARLEAQQLILSPMFAVPGKGPAWGFGKLRVALDTLPAAPVRILALGGITAGNVASLRHPRLDGVALIRTLWSAPDPAQAVAQIRAAWSS